MELSYFLLKLVIRSLNLLTFLNFCTDLNTNLLLKSNFFINYLLNKLDLVSPCLRIGSVSSHLCSSFNLFDLCLDKARVMIKKLLMFFGLMNIFLRLFY
jgi:hypothetical protein